MKKLCLVLVCFAVGVGGWMGLYGRSSAGSSLGASPDPSGYRGALSQPPLRLPDRPQETTDEAVTALVLGTLIGLVVVAGTVAARRDCAASLDSKNGHGNPPSPAHERAVRPAC